MSDGCEFSNRFIRLRPRALIAAGAVLLCVFGGVAEAENGAPQSLDPPAQAQPAKDKPGFLAAMKYLLSRPVELVSNGMRQTQDAVGRLGGQTGDAAKGVAGAATDAASGAVGAAGDAAKTVLQLPSTRFVKGREACVRAGNGGPDCAAAAVTMCRAKGFQRGTSVDSESQEDCPARVLLSGRSAQPGECTLTYYVTRAVCQ